MVDTVLYARYSASLRGLHRIFYKPVRRSSAFDPYMATLRDILGRELPFPLVQSAVPHRVPGPPLWDPQIRMEIDHSLHSIHMHHIIQLYFSRTSPWVPLWAQAGDHSTPAQALDGHKMARKWVSRLCSANTALVALISVERIRNSMSNEQSGSSSMKRAFEQLIPSKHHWMLVR